MMLTAFSLRRNNIKIINAIHWHKSSAASCFSTITTNGSRPFTNPNPSSQCYYHCATNNDVTNSIRLYHTTTLKQKAAISKEQEQETSTESRTLKNQESNDDDDVDTSKSIPLYHRTRTIYPKTVLYGTTLHTAYWTWYVLDFTPALNLDPTLGYVGLSLALFMSCGGVLYPTSLIQSMRLISTETKNDANNKINTNIRLGIKTYTLPFVRPSKREKVYDLGEFHIDSPNDVTKMIRQGRREDIQSFNSHLAFHAKDRYVNLLMHLNEDYKNEDLVQNEDLWFKYLSPSTTVLSGVVANSRGGAVVGTTRQTGNRRNTISKRGVQKQKRRERLRRRAAASA